MDRILYHVKFGKYEAFITDKSLVGISCQPQYKQYFNNFKILIYFKNIETEETKLINIPVLDVFPLSRIKKTTQYVLHRQDKTKSFELWLFNLLKSKNIQIIEYPQLKLDNPFGVELRKYYLQSEIGDKAIRFSKTPVEHKIESINDRMWLRENGFYDSIIEWKQRKDKS